MINSLYAHSMTLAAAGAWDRANLDLVVARVEDDILELEAPATDAVLGIGDEAAVDGDAGANGAANQEVIVDEESDSEVSLPSDTDSETMSHISCSTTSDSNAGSDVRDGSDTDSIVSEPGSPRRIVNIGPPGTMKVVTGAIAGDDQSAEADANAEVGVIENRHDDTVPWEDYYAPAPDGGDDDDDGDDGGDGDDDEGDLDLRPIERAQLRFDTNLAGRLQTFAETRVADKMLVQMLTHG